MRTAGPIEAGGAQTVTQPEPIRTRVVAQCAARAGMPQYQSSVSALAEIVARADPHYNDNALRPCSSHSSTPFG